MKAVLGIYKEGLRQTKVFGLTALLLAAAFSLYDAAESGSLDGLNVILYLISIFLLPGCLIKLFSFAWSRAASDFYHSLSATREQVYAGFSLASITWTAAASALPILGLLAFPTGDNSFLQTLINYLSMWILVCGGVCLASSVMGGVLGSVCASGVILYMPRLLIEMMCGAIRRDAVVFYQSGLLSSRINPVFYNFIGAFGFLYDPFTIWTRLAYSIVVGGAFYAIGMICFKRRPSESAGSSAVNKWVQLAVRVGLAFSVCILAFSAVMTEDLGWEIAFLMWFVALVVYFVYDLITAGKGAKQKLGLSMTGVGALVVLNIAMFAFLYVGAKTVIAFRPEASDIKSVRVSLGTNDYNDLLAGKVDVSDRETVELLTNALDKDIRAGLSSDGFLYNHGVKGGYSLFVTYKAKGGRTAVREINITENDMKKLGHSLMKNGDFAQALTGTPDSSKLTLDSVSSDLDLAPDCDDEFITGLYDALDRELSTMTNEQRLYSGVFPTKLALGQWIELGNEGTMRVRPCDLRFCDLCYTRGAYSLRRYVTAATPETAGLLLGHTADENDVASFIEAAGAEHMGFAIYKITPPASDGGMYTVDYTFLEGREGADMVAEIAQNDGDSGLSNPFFIVTAVVYGEYKGESDFQSNCVTDLFFTKG